MKIIWLSLKSRLVTYFYVILDKIGFSKNNAIIFMFHHVSNDDINASAECKCNVDHFTSILEYLKINNIPVVSVNNAIAKINAGIRSGFAVITFDDGLDNTFDVAYPLLKIYNLPFTVYITWNYIDKKGYLTSEQLEILSNETLCTIGAHSLSHPVLRTSINSREEIIRSKQLLEQKLGREIMHFAYPYGGPTAVSLNNIFEAKDAGYHSAVSTVESRLNFFSTRNRLYLPRVNGSFFKTNKN